MLTLLIEKRKMGEYNKESGSEAITIGTQAWNIADGYTKIKILRLLIQLDVDQKIAMFGKKDDLDNIPPEEIPRRRIEGFHMFLFDLKMLMGNCEFAIKRKIDKIVIGEFYKRIENVEKYSDMIAYYSINDVTKENKLIINEKHFKLCFDILWEIKNHFNIPLDRADLIFRKTQELDLDEIMRDIEEGG